MFFAKPSWKVLYCKESSAQIIHSSGTIIHGFQKTKFSFTTAISPDTDYGKSKLLGDNNINESGCKAAIIRFGGVFGNDGPNHLGINTAINDAQLGIQPELVGQGKALRNYIFVEDAAKAIMTCINDKLHGTFYADGGGKLSIKSMLECIREEIIPDKEIEVVPGMKEKIKLWNLA